MAGICNQCLFVSFIILSQIVLFMTTRKFVLRYLAFLSYIYKIERKYIVANIFVSVCI